MFVVLVQTFTQFASTNLHLCKLPVAKSISTEDYRAKQNAAARERTKRKLVGVYIVVSILSGGLSHLAPHGGLLCTDAY